MTCKFPVAKLHQVELQIECIHKLYTNAEVFIYLHIERTLAQNQSQKCIFPTSTCHSKTPLKNHTFHLPITLIVQFSPGPRLFGSFCLSVQVSIVQVVSQKFKMWLPQTKTHLSLQAVTPAAIYSQHQWLGPVSSPLFFL